MESHILFGTSTDELKNLLIKGMIRILLRTWNINNCVTGSGGCVYSFYHLFTTTVQKCYTHIMWNF